MSSFQFYHWNQFKVIPLAYTRRTRNPKIFCDVGRELTAYTAHNADAGSDDRPTIESRGMSVI